jgi:hypothetical protein
LLHDRDFTPSGLSIASLNYHCGSKES